MKVDPSYCLFEAIDIQSMTITCCSLILLFFLFILYTISVSKYNQIVSKCSKVSLLPRPTSQKRVTSFNQIVYTFLLMWYIFSVARYILNISAYLYITNPYQPSDPSNYCVNQQTDNHEITLIDHFAPIQVFLDKICAFIIHSILLKIPYVWLRQISNNYDIFLKQELDMPIRYRIKSIDNGLKVMEKYYKFRLIIPAMYLLWLIFTEIYTGYAKYSRQIAIISMAEALIVIITYTYGLIKLKSLSEPISIRQADLRKMFCYYFLLIACCLIRICCIVLFYQDNSDFWVTCDFHQGNLNRNLYLSVGYYLTHIMPVSIIQIIYWPDKELQQILKQTF